MNSLTAFDGVTIPVTWTRNGNDQILLFCHGITSDRDEDGIFSDFYNEYYADSADAFYFDFRGHGQSEVSSENSTIKGMRDDLRTCIGYLRTFTYNKIAIIAASFGASIVLLESSSLHKNAVNTVVFWNPVVSYEDTFVTPLTDWARKFFPGAKPRDSSFSSSIMVPDTDFIIGPQMAREIATLHPEESKLPPSASFFCIHGTNDQHVPFHSTETFCMRNSRNTQLCPIMGACHGFPDHTDELYKATAEWLKANLL